MTFPLLTATLYTVVFLRQWSGLITQHQAKVGCDCCSSILLLFRRVAVPSVVRGRTVFLLLCFFYWGHPWFRNFNSIIPGDVHRHVYHDKQQPPFPLWLLFVRSLNSIILLFFYYFGMHMYMLYLSVRIVNYSWLCCVWLLSREVWKLSFGMMYFKP